MSVRQEGDVLDEDGFTQARSDAIALVRELAPLLVRGDAHPDESIVRASEHEPAEVKRADVFAAGRAADGALELVEGTWTERMAAAGWDVRDRPSGDELDRIWSRDGRALGVRVARVDDDLAVFVTASTPPARVPGIDSGKPRPKDPWYLPV